jgi:hypothetical protein
VLAGYLFSELEGLREHKPIEAAAKMRTLQQQISISFVLCLAALFHCLHWYLIYSKRSPIFLKHVCSSSAFTLVDQANSWDSSDILAGVIFSPHGTNLVKPLEYTGSQLTEIP